MLWNFHLDQPIRPVARLANFDATNKVRRSMNSGPLDIHPPSAANHVIDRFGIPYHDLFDLFDNLISIP